MSIGSEFEQPHERVVHVRDNTSAVWVQQVPNGSVLFCFEDDAAGTVRSVRMSAEEWQHLTTVPVVL